ncbi:hypothetical protein SCP_0706240 [Sparassis crispa]|uniref:Uncharacterized protein n=1 Tax=Sparassis crispa TaxID=139825 RepID=A0A401GT99_9APHY|nr:hypothetical protein SCP_0706240 [Sparassis crispa]GBE85437.1 hypothetical protein SCP_0706240 [Sparassis crispa]
MFGVTYFSLPVRRQKYLDELLIETEKMWRMAVEDGLLIDSLFARKTERNLANLHTQADDLRTETYHATTLYHQVKGALTGLSFKIICLCGRVVDLRATISTTTTEERKRLRNEGRYYPLGSRRIARPAGETANPGNPFDEAERSSTDNACDNDGSDNTYCSPRSEPSAVAPTEDESSGLASLDTEDFESRHTPSATVDVEEVPIQVVEKDLGVIRPSLCTKSDQGNDGALQQHPPPTDSALYKILDRVYHDLSAEGQSHPLLSAAAQYTRAPHTVDLDSLLQEYEGDASTTPTDGRKT